MNQAKVLIAIDIKVYFLSGDNEEMDTEPSPTVSDMTAHATQQRSTTVKKQLMVSELMLDKLDCKE